MFNAFLQRAVGAGLIVSLTVLTSCGSNVAPGAAEAAASTSTATVVATPTTTTATTGANIIAAAGLAGEAAIADNFTTADGIEVSGYGTADKSSPSGGLPSESPDPQGAFRMTCLAGQLLKDDPLIMPGQVGASHLHQFWGNTGTNANSTYQTLRSTGQTTCSSPSSSPVNRTAYWMPAMLDGAGHAVKPDLILTYYKQRPASDPNCKVLGTACVPLPNGLRFTYGYNMKTGTGGPADPNATEYWMTRYECWKDDSGAIAVAGTFHTIADVVKAGCPAGARLVIAFVAPACWDGQNVDVTDHRSHVVYATRNTPVDMGCPADHPYLIPNWSGHIHYTTDANFVAGKWHLSSDEMMPGAVAGSTLHFDYWEAWSPTVKATWQQYCVDAHKTCSAGDLGNGTQIKHGPETSGTIPSHQLITLQ